MTYMKYIATPIAIVAILSNLCIITIFLRNHLWLKKPYYMFILNLAFTDMAAGIFLAVAPRMSFKPMNVPDNELLGRLYCQTMEGYWLFFALGAVSVFTCLFLTVERWTAICRPFKYRIRFATRKRLIIYLIIIWITGFGTSRIGAVVRKYQPKAANITTSHCISKDNFSGWVTVLSVSIKFFIPSATILVLYGLAIQKIRQTATNDVPEYNNKRGQAIRNVTKMAATASFVLIICWLPNQINFILVKYGVLKLFGHFHNFTIILVSLNSALNPLIYASWAKQFRVWLKFALCQCNGSSPKNDVVFTSGQPGTFEFSTTSGRSNIAFTRRDT